MKTSPLVALLTIALTAPAARADAILPPPPPPPQSEVVAQVVAGSALGFAVMRLGVWLARRRARSLVTA